MHTIEKELIKATGYKARKKYADRQDYLGSILNDVLKLTDDDFENLSDEAATWANNAVEAKNSKSDIEDFDETVVAEDEDEPADEAGDDEADETSEDEEASEDDGDDETDPTDDNPEVDEPEEKPSKKKAASKVKEKAKPEKDAAPAKAKAGAPPKGKRPPQFDKGDVVLDKFGAMKDSKNSQALAMFEKGATTKEVKDELGGTYYNILKRCAEAGHHLDKAGAVITLTHKDDVGSGKKQSNMKAKPPKKK